MAPCYCCNRKQPNENEEVHDILPPKTRKKALVDGSQFEKIDKLSSSLPRSFLKKPIGKIVDRLMKNVDQSDELGRVRSIFVFMTNLDLNAFRPNSTQEYSKRHPITFLEWLCELKANLINHAHLFKMLCSHANIPCEVISGITKNSAYKIGYQIKPDQLKAQWNAVYVCGDWRLIDVYWASCARMKSKAVDWMEDGIPFDVETEQGSYFESRIMNDFYFLTDPDMLIATHLPDNAEWQLLPKPISFNRFEKTVYIRDKFFALELSPSLQTKSSCILETIDGLAEIGFRISEAKANSASFMYLLNNIQSDCQFNSWLPAEQCVFDQLQYDSLGFTLRFPKPGMYRFDVFGSENQNDLYDLVCSYIIQCKAPKKNCSPLPVKPEDGWGPTLACHILGVVPESHNGVVVKVSEGVCEMKFSVNRHTTIKWRISATGKDDSQFKNQMISWRDGDDLLLQTRLRTEGEHVLEIVASDILGRSENVCNYLLDVESCSRSAFPLLRGAMLGPAELADHFEVKPINKESPIIRTKTRDLTIMMTKSIGLEMLMEVTSNANDATNATYTSMSSEQSEQNVLFKIRLPSDDGEFGINLFVRHKSEEAIYHVYTYYVILNENSHPEGDSIATEPGKDTESPKPLSDHTESPKPFIGNNESTKPVIDNTESPKPFIDNTESKTPVTDNAESPKPFIDQTESPKLFIDKTESPKSAIDNTESPKPFIDKTESQKPVIDNTESKKPVIDSTESLKLVIDNTESAKPVIDSTESSKPFIINPISPGSLKPIGVKTTKNRVTNRFKTRQNPVYCELRPEELKQAATKNLDFHMNPCDEDTLFSIGLPEHGVFSMNLFEEVSPGCLSAFSVYKIQHCLCIDEIINEIGDFKSLKDEKIANGSSKEETNYEDSEKVNVEEQGSSNSEDKQNTNIDNEGKKDLTVEENFDMKAMEAAKRQEELIACLWKTLQAALESKNLYLLKDSLKQMEDLKVKDKGDGLLCKAKEMLLLLSIKDGISKAVSDNDQGYLRHLLESISDNSLQAHFAEEMVAAKEHLEYLKRQEHLEKLRQQRLDILNINAPTMSEVRSYLNPPLPVLLVMKATCLIIGVEKDQLMDWVSVKKIMSQTGKMSLQYKVYQFDAENLSEQTAKEAQSVIEGLTLDDVVSVSPCAAKFFAWAISIIKEFWSRVQHASNKEKKLASRRFSLPNAVPLAAPLAGERNFSKRRLSQISNLSRGSKTNSDLDRFQHIKEIWDSLGE